MDMKKHPLYRRWWGMMERCYKPNNANYKYYGAKGITVCNSWHDFWIFVEDVETRLENGYLLYKKGWQLDKDKKGGETYSLENCVVVSSKENRELAYEKQQRIILAVSESEKIIFKSISEASRILNIPRNTIQLNLKKDRVHSSGYRFKYVN